MSATAVLIARRYARARDRFVRAASAAGARLADALVLPDRTGPDGEALAVDVAWLEPAPTVRDWMVVVSGTHGIEGYGGSALQSTWLERGGAALARDCGVLMIHALNPWGMAWWSRADHEGIDLNRNFLQFPARVDNPGYALLHPRVCAPEVDSLTQAALAELFEDFVGAYGAQGLTNALIGPQSTHPDGMNFTGHAPSWSRRLLEASLACLLEREPRRVLLVDLHAGVAPRGEIAVLHFPADEQDAARARRLLDLGRPGLQFGAQGLANYSGLLVQGAQRLLGDRVCAVVAELGTVDRQGIRQALRLDRWLRHHGDPDRDLRIRDQLLEVFCPIDPDWERDVLQRGLELLDLGRAGLLGRWDAGSSGSQS
jgi:hypothetical protein